MLNKNLEFYSNDNKKYDKIYPLLKIIGRWGIVTSFHSLLEKGIIGLKSLSQESVQIGSVSVSIVILIKWVAILISYIVVVSAFSYFWKKELAKNHTMSKPTKVLLQKLVNVLVYSVLAIIALDTAGINLSSLTVFGGALSVGIGFGLQKITSNFISGIILIYERSVQIGDLIQLEDGTLGTVSRLKSRYTELKAYDGRDILIPNEHFITHMISNLTLSSKQARISLTIGVSYDADIKHAQALITNAATSHPRIAEEPKPQCYLENFGASSVDFKLNCFVNDVTKGRAGVTSEILMDIWDAFKNHNIDIPFPQHDIHLIKK